MYIGSGREVHCTYLGQPIVVIGQTDGDSDGETEYQKENFTSPINVFAKVFRW